MYHNHITESIYVNNSKFEAKIAEHDKIMIRKIGQKMPLDNISFNSEYWRQLGFHGKSCPTKYNLVLPLETQPLLLERR